MIKNMPIRIYLQVGETINDNETIDFKELDEITWCNDRIHQSDVCYIRAGKPYNAKDEEFLKFLHFLHCGTKTRISESFNSLIADYKKYKTDCDQLTNNSK